MITRHFVPQELTSPRMEYCYSSVATLPLVSWESKFLLIMVSYLSLSSLICFVSKNEEREVIRVFRVGLDKEILAPEVKVLEASCISDIIDQHTSLSSTIECHSQTLIPFLSSSVPDLIIIISLIISRLLKVSQS